MSMRDEFEKWARDQFGSETVELYDDAGYVTANLYEAWQAAREQGAEPVAYAVYWGDGEVELHEAPLPSLGDEPEAVTPLYTQPQSAGTITRDDLIQCLLATQGQSEGVAADAILSMIPATGRQVAITPAMIEAGAQRLVAWEDSSVWPDSWDSMTVAAARNDAERVIRSALGAADHIADASEKVAPACNCPVRSGAHDYDCPVHWFERHQHLSQQLKQAQAQAVKLSEAGERLCYELESWLATEHDKESARAIKIWNRLCQRVDELEAGKAGGDRGSL